MSPFNHLILLLPFLSLLLTAAPSLPSNHTLDARATTSCKCGYVLTQYSNAYFPLSHSTNFANLPQNTRLQTSDFERLGWQVSNGWQAGAANEQDGTTPIGSIDALSAQWDTLFLTVKGGQKKGGEVKVGEITFLPVGGQGITGGVMTMSAKLSSTPGTCQSIFTYKRGDNVRDEQDIEVLGQQIFKPAPNGTPAGIQLTQYQPNGQGTNDFAIAPFPADPTAAFHNYTIAWLPTGTKYYFDKTALKGPTKYSSVNPSDVIINHWSAGIEGFTEGPPTQDVVMKVKTVQIYYKTKAQSGLPAGCSLAQACKV